MRLGKDSILTEYFKLTPILFLILVIIKQYNCYIEGGLWTIKLIPLSAIRLSRNQNEGFSINTNYVKSFVCACPWSPIWNWTRHACGIRENLGYRGKMLISILNTQYFYCPPHVEKVLQNISIVHFGPYRARQCRIFAIRIFGHIEEWSS